MDNRGKLQFQLFFMKKRAYIVIGILGTIPFFGMGQVRDSLRHPFIAPLPSPPDTNVRIYAPTDVKNTEDKIYQYQRYNHGTSPGFRVQIDFSQDRNEVNKTQSDFSGKYPGVTSYMTYKQPYFRISVGDFRTRLEAIAFLNKVRKDYPAAFVVADKIVPPPL